MTSRKYGIFVKYGKLKHVLGCVHWPFNGVNHLRAGLRAHASDQKFRIILKTFCQLRKHFCQLGFTAPSQLLLLLVPNHPVWLIYMLKLIENIIIRFKYNVPADEKTNKDNNDNEYETTSQSSTSRKQVSSFVFPIFFVNLHSFIGDWISTREYGMFALFWI